MLREHGVLAHGMAAARARRYAAPDATRAIAFKPAAVEHRAAVLNGNRATAKPTKEQEQRYVHAGAPPSGARRPCALTHNPNGARHLMQRHPSTTKSDTFPHTVVQQPQPLQSILRSNGLAPFGRASSVLELTRRTLMW